MLLRRYREQTEPAKVETPEKQEQPAEKPKAKSSRKK